MGVILWLSDLHYDPYYGLGIFAASYKAGDNCALPDNATQLEYPYGQVGCDTPRLLLEFALENANNHKNNIDFILVTGGFSRHSLLAAYNEVGKSNNHLCDTRIALNSTEVILRNTVQSIQKALPGVPIVPVIGNNDVIPDYYFGLETTKMTRDLPDVKTMLAHVSKGLKNAFMTPEEVSAFSHGGYFSRLVDLPSSSPKKQSSILVLSLNTVFYSVKHQPDPEPQDENGNLSHPKDPHGQFAWMKSQLQMAAAASSSPNIVGVYLAGHIPPSIGSYRHSQQWHDQYLDEFFTILQDYSEGKYHPHKRKSKTPPILGNFYGHVHAEEFRLLTHDSQEATKEGLEIPVLITSSLSPIYGANPSYRLVEYDDKSGALLDYNTHYLDLDKVQHQKDDAWIALPSFVEAYGVPDLSLKSFQRLFQSLEEGLVKCSSNRNRNRKIDLTLWETFWDRQDLFSSKSDDANDSVKSPADDIMDWMCTFRASTSQDYESCLERKQLESSTPCTTSSTTIALSVAAVGGLVFFGIVVSALYLGKKRPFHRKHPVDAGDGIHWIQDIYQDNDNYHDSEDDDDNEYNDEEDHIELAADLDGLKKRAF